MKDGGAGSVDDIGASTTTGRPMLDTPASDAPASAPVSAALLAALAETFEGDPPLPKFATWAGSVVVATTRRLGQSIQRGWIARPSTEAALADVIAALDLTDIDTVELNLCHSLRSVPADLKSNALDNRHAGLIGVAILSAEGIHELRAPTELISGNRPPQRAMQQLLESAGLTPAEFASGRMVPAIFEAEQYLCRISPDGIDIRPLFRGARPVELAPLTEAGMRTLADGMTIWMLNQVQPNGRMPYKFWPTRGVESDGDNTIRQAMATICLGRIAQRSPNQAIRDRADRNLDHLIATYFRNDGPHGIVIEGDKVKLGALALTGLAVLESPQRGRYEAVLARLVETIAFLQNPRGSFRTFYAPAERNDCQNFYPGEALLFWAHALKAGVPGVTSEAYMHAFRYYRWHFRNNPNPAFIPWHTQADFVARDIIANPELDDFIFEMNDWLLSVQQWHTAPSADMLGRFFDPARPWLGTAHASATGVYLEGLVDAFALARLRNDGARVASYRQAILRAAKNLARLQFRTDDDMFYVRHRRRVEGGIRTETYDNEIRVDNVQHGLMGLQRVLERFTAADYGQANT